MSPLRTVSLFSGIGLLDLGLERAGIETALLCERDPKARTVLTRHWPNTPLHRGDDITASPDGWRHRDCGAPDTPTNPCPTCWPVGPCDCEDAL